MGRRQGQEEKGLQDDEEEEGYLPAIDKRKSTKKTATPLPKSTENPGISSRTLRVIEVGGRIILKPALHSSGSENRPAIEKRQKRQRSKRKNASCC